MFTENMLQQFAEQFLQKNYGITLTIPVKINNRLRTTLGRYVYSSTGTPIKIELAGSVITYGTKETIHNILKHECIHFAFHKLNKKMEDGDPCFEAELIKHNAPSTHSLKVGKFYIFQCEKCSKKSETNIKNVKKYPQKYRTTCCSARLNIVKERIYRGL